MSSVKPTVVLCLDVGSLKTKGKSVRLIGLHVAALSGNLSCNRLVVCSGNIIKIHKTSKRPNEMDQIVTGIARFGMMDKIKVATWDFRGCHKKDEELFRELCKEKQNKLAITS